MKFKLTASIVLYKNEIRMLEKAISSFLTTQFEVVLYLIDNSPTDKLKVLEEMDERIIYIYSNENIGFGAGHNVAIKKMANSSKYHLILNPDIFFKSNVCETICRHLDENLDIGVIMPKILYPNGNIQYLAKLIPTPFDFFYRRLIPITWLKNILTEKFELRVFDYGRNMEAPYLSGCFLVFRTSILKKINGFDEQIFLHMEDLDITRRVNLEGYKSLYFSEVSVFHDHSKKSIKDFNNFRIYLKSAFYYFNKWGWFFDSNRRKINKETIQKLNK